MNKLFKLTYINKLKATPNQLLYNLFKLYSINTIKSQIYVNSLTEMYIEMFTKKNKTTWFFTKAYNTIKAL